MGAGAEKWHKFQGAQPISFDQDHLVELEQMNYFVSEKADGIRCLLYMHRDQNCSYEVFLVGRHSSQTNPASRNLTSSTIQVDRKNDYYFIDNLRFPLAGPPPPNDPCAGPGIEAFHFDTILDGELVLDVDNGNRYPRFLLFDCMVLDGENVMSKPFTKRLGRLKEFILKPHDHYVQTRPDYAAHIPFTVELKELQLSYYMDAVVASQPHLKHGSDGLLFTARDAPYVIGQCDKMLKWKPSDENTADFRVRYDPGERQFYLQIVHRGGINKDVCAFALDSEMEEDWLSNPTAYEGKIVECRYDLEWPGNWRFSRFRDDKDTANYIDVFNSIMRTIMYPVPQDVVGFNGLLSLRVRLTRTFFHSFWRERTESGRPGKFARRRNSR
jgi:mRNA guanylyltransferase